MQQSIPARAGAFGEITRALHAAQERAAEAADQLFRLVQAELRRRIGPRQRPGRDASSQTTSLVHEVFLRLERARVPWQNRNHYFAVASLTAQRLILDHARSRSRRKRGGRTGFVALDDDLAAYLPDPDFLLDLQAAFERLGHHNPRWRRMAELRAYGGLDNRGIAVELGVSRSTVEHDWIFVRAWLHRELGCRE